MSIAGSRDDAGKVDLDKPRVSQNSTCPLTLIAVVQDDNPASDEVGSGYLCTTPPEGTVIIDDEHVVLDRVMREKRIDFCVYIQRRDDQLD